MEIKYVSKKCKAKRWWASSRVLGGRLFAIFKHFPLCVILLLLLGLSMDSHVLEYCRPNTSTSASLLVLVC